MTDKNLILYLPMDDPDNSTVAYDYSKSRADAQLSGGAHFSREAKIGKSLALGNGEAQTPLAINFDGDLKEKIQSLFYINDENILNFNYKFRW